MTYRPATEMEVVKFFEDNGYFVFIDAVGKVVFRKQGEPVTEAKNGMNVSNYRYSEDFGMRLEAKNTWR